MPSVKTLLATVAQCVVSAVHSRTKPLAVASILSIFACVTSLLLDQPIEEQLQKDMVQPLQPQFHCCSPTGWFCGALATQVKVKRAEVEGDCTALPTHRARVCHLHMLAQRLPLCTTSWSAHSGIRHKYNATVVPNAIIV